MSLAKHSDDTFQALADRLRTRDVESLIASKVTVDEHIDTQLRREGGMGGGVICPKASA